MRHTLLILLVCLAVSCTSDAAPAGSDDVAEPVWTSAAALIAYGLVAGLAAGWFAAGFGSKRLKPQRERPSKTPYDAGATADAGLEQKYYTLVEREKKLQEAHRKQERLFAEYRRLYGPKDKPQKEPAHAVGEQPDALPEENQQVREPARLYFLQPSGDGRFIEANSVADAGNALYELCCSNDQPEEASLRYIGSPRYTSFAIEHEATWILVACERSNLPSPQTQAVRTDTPGKAIYQDGIWQIVEKIKITYV
ncbi:hypothetical protein [Taibaiella koreensis]|uniref:hypothetical protein n=1 Tax=Taibaiella koreensis TaxID=1268548 RepID=UPI000E59B5DB|nr:hypothetical protein [Taibaiella koreensis]